ncbi:MAG: 3-isopropylmalate dehydratase small subunit [Rikenellaceae bacterium]|nr:3-isopropylmalate dehydratase small subunit [Rikenellaceae bacterium]
MGFEKFKILKSGTINVQIENIDTDQIIPARFLKTTTREGFGKNLFYDWRYDNHGELIQSSELNENNGKKILVAGRNFGCGSSREHAAWAIYDYGFRAVISSFFADIFKNNALNNGLLPVQVSDDFLNKIFKNRGSDIIINLPERSVTICITGDKECFQINSYKQNCLINGLDDIEYLISCRQEIENFENKKNKYE